MASKVAELLLKIKTSGEESINKVSELMGGLGTIAVGAMAAIGAAIVKSVSEYGEQEKAVNSLTRTMVNNGVYSKELKDAYLEQADALSKVTLFGDEQIIQAQSAFSQQAKGVKLTKEYTNAILDFAQAQGIDAANAAELVGKAVGTGTNALARYGIELSSTASKSEKMTQVLAGLNSKFGGQATAATDGLGSLQLLSKSVGELFENVGSRLAPTITFLAKELLSLVNTSPMLDSFINAVGDGFNFISRMGYSVALTFEQAGTVIGGTLGTIAGSLELLVSGKFSAAKDALVSGFEEIGNQTTSITEKYATKIQALADAHYNSQVENAAKEKELLVQSLAQKNQIIEEDRISQQEKYLENAIAESELKSQTDLALLSGRQSAIYASEVADADRRYQLAVTQNDKNKALQDKYRATQLMNDAKYNEARLENLKGTLGTITSLSSSSNATLAGIGKAAALTQIAIDTPVAIGRALASAPPPFNYGLAAAVGLAMGQQAAKISGVQLAEGGIVMPRPGGTQATIGEAGQAEAVIPLDRASEFGLGSGGKNNITLVVNGGMLGTETEAREFAIAIDKELLKLRRNNESVSFDSGVI